ncbi:MAG TPA: WYL domain-containing protein [Thiobacillaceae bacterium]|nr:WYL domain-containing protein [Thiobacillaceae bacterium]
MDQFTRIFMLHQLLKTRRRPVSMAVITDKLECSRSTASRTIGELRDLLHAPLEYDPRARGYRYATDGDSYELPGLWFTRDELRAFVAFQEMLKGVGPGMLSELMAPFIDYAHILLSINGRHHYAVENRFIITGVQAKPVDRRVFNHTVTAIMKRRRLRIDYLGRHSGERTEREVSPQLLLHYRGNWYMGAWCHLREDLRTFALDRIKTAQVLDTQAQEVDSKRLKQVFEASYGIYSGEPQAWAVLRFTPEQAVWEAGAIWHPEQEARYLEDGRYELKIPYASTGEIVHEILARTPDVEVVSPPELRALVLEKLREGVRRLEE